MWEDGRWLTWIDYVRVGGVVSKLGDGALSSMHQALGLAPSTRKKKVSSIIKRK